MHSQARRTHRTVCWFLVASLSLLIAAELRAEDGAAPPTNPRAQLENAWWETAKLIGDGAPWAECAERLEAGLAAGEDSELTPRCQALLASIRLSEASPVSPAALEATDTSARIAALSDSRVNLGLIPRPLQVVVEPRRTFWAYLAASAPPGPGASAYLLHTEGRSAIPALIDALDDLRATRTVASDRTRFQEPTVLRVADISMALIEAISLCRLHSESAAYNLRSNKLPLISEWPPARRAEQIERVRDWWEATRELPPSEAVLWRLERAEPEQQLEMVDALIALDMRTEALRFLVAHYRQGMELDYEFAQRLLRTGSRIPLEYSQEATAAGQPIQQDAVRLIAEFGTIDDFELLRDAILQPCAGTMQVDVDMVVNVLNSCDSPLAIPVLVAVIESRDRAAQADASQPDPRLPETAPGVVAGYLLRAGAHIETLARKDFGFDRKRSPYILAHGFDDIHDWWQREGRAAYDYGQISPQAPGGIR